MKTDMQNNLPDILRMLDPERWGGAKGRLFSLLQATHRICISFKEHQGGLHASALTFSTILSLIPLLAIAFALLKGFGVQNVLEPFLLQVAGDSEETISRIIGYVNNTNVKSMGVVGLLMLVFAVISLLGDIENAFNSIWGVRQRRSFQRRISDYLSVIVVGPILLLAATSMTTTLQSQKLVTWLVEHTYLGDTVLMLFRMVPYLFVWGAMIFIYLCMPNTRVRLGSAALGGVLAGTVWQIAQWGYFYFQVGVSNYNAIYGTMASLPIFLVWVYCSWIIVLFGLEVVYAHQHRLSRAGVMDSHIKSETARDVFALSALLLVCSAFDSAEPPLSSSVISAELGIGTDEALGLLVSLKSLNFLVKTNEENGWIPACDPSHIMLDDVMSGLRGSLPSAEDFPAVCKTAIDLIGREVEMRGTCLRGLTVNDMIITFKQLQVESGSVVEINEESGE